MNCHFFGKITTIKSFIFLKSYLSFFYGEIFIKKVLKYIGNDNCFINAVEDNNEKKVFLIIEGLVFIIYL